MTQLDYGALGSAMAGYNPQGQQSAQSTNPLQSILPMALQIGGSILGAGAGPLGSAAGSAIGTGLGELVTGQGIDAGQVGQSALFGLMPGMGGAKAAKAAKTAAAADATEGAIAKGAAKAATTGAQEGLEAGANKAASTLTGGRTPTNLDPETNTGHINFVNDEAGKPTIDTANTYTPQQIGQLPQTSGGNTGVPASNGSTPVAPQSPRPQPATGSDATSRYTPQQANRSTTLSGSQQFARNEAVSGMTKTMHAAGMKVNNAEVNNLANQALDLGYNDFPTLARDAQTLTGRDYGVDNAVNNMVRQASIGDSVGNPSTIDASDIMTPDARNAFVNQATRGTTRDGAGGVAYTDAQRKVFNNAVQDQNVALAGAGANGYRSVDEAIQAGDLIKIPTGGYELTSQGMKNINPVDALQTQRNFANMAAQAKTSGESDLYQSVANALNDKLGQINITKEGAQNVLANLQESGFAQSNPTQYARLSQGLQDGTISNVNQLRSFTAPWVRASVAYSKATGGASMFDLAAGGRGAISKNIMSSGTAGKLQVKAARAASKLTAKNGSQTAFNNTTSGGGRVVSGGGGMSPLGKIAAVAGGLGALGLGANAVGTANQANQAQAMMNDPNYQQTQELLGNSNQLQRYLGQMGEIRSVFAPTFDSNASQAGQMGQNMLAQANQQQAAQAAVANLLQSRAQMGQGGILGGVLSLVPGTSQNAYAQQAANAQAQLNSLGVAGNVPSVAQNGGSIQSLGNIANSVGAF